MLFLADIRDYIATLNVTTDENVYSGKLDSKKQKSIGVYKRKTTYPPRLCMDNAQTYEIKPISLLVHWNKSQRDTEKAAFLLFTKLKEIKNLYIGDVYINYAKILNVEPIDIGTDEGIYESLIEFDLYYRKEVL